MIDKCAALHYTRLTAEEVLQLCSKVGSAVRMLQCVCIYLYIFVSLYIFSIYVRDMFMCSSCCTTLFSELIATSVHYYAERVCVF